MKLFEGPKRRAIKTTCSKTSLQDDLQFINLDEAHVIYPQKDLEAFRQKLSSSTKAEGYYVVKTKNRYQSSNPNANHKFVDEGFNFSGDIILVLRE